MSSFKDFVQETAAKSPKKKTPEEWLLGVAKVANYCSFVTHTSKYASPDGETTVLWETKRNENPRKPYVSTGSVDCAIDVVGGASATPAGKAVTFVMDDGIDVLEHLKKDDSSDIRDTVEGFGIDYPTWRESVMEVKHCEKPTATSSSVPQVFFPINDSDEYHILSVLPSGCVMQEVRKRISDYNSHRDEVSEAEAPTTDNVPEEQAEEKEPTPKKRYIKHILTKHGGGNPVNISLNNNNAAGMMFMITSLPPQTKPRRIFRPHGDFFNSLRLKPYVESFFKMHKIYVNNRNNKEIRVTARDIEKDIMERMLLTVFALREEPAGWSDKCSLPPEQCVWLDEKYAEFRTKDKGWIKPLSESFADWFIESYEFLLRGKKVGLGDGEKMALYSEVMDFIEEEIKN